jgi:hypothetical protein
MGITLWSRGISEQMSRSAPTFRRGAVRALRSRGGCRGLATGNSHTGLQHLARAANEGRIDAAGPYFNLDETWACRGQRAAAAPPSESYAYFRSRSSSAS